MMRRPPAQTRLLFEKSELLETDTLSVEVPEFKVGDKVVFDPQYPHMKGVFETIDVTQTWSGPMYSVIRYSEKGVLWSSCAAKALKVS